MIHVHLLSLCCYVSSIHGERVCARAGNVRPHAHTRRMHQITDLYGDYDRNDRPRVIWNCECGSKGSGATRNAAMGAYKRHLRAAARKEYGGR